MPKIKPLSVLAFLALSAAVSAVGEEAAAPLVSAPELDFVRHRVSQEGSSVYRLDFDIDADGRIDQLIASSDFLNGKQGYLWVIYRQQEDEKYAAVHDGIVWFHPDWFYAGELAPIKPRLETIGAKIEDSATTVGLLTSSPGGGGYGVLLLHHWVNGKLETVRLKDRYSPRFNADDAAFSTFVRELVLKQDLVRKHPVLHYAPLVPLSTTANRLDLMTGKNREVISYTPDREGRYTSQTMVLSERKASPE